MNDDLNKLMTASGGIKILPGDQIPKNAQFHLCLTYPVENCANFTGFCDKCGCVVYFSDQRPNLKKICEGCALERAKDGGVENFGTFNSISRAILRNKQN